MWFAWTSKRWEVGGEEGTCASESAAWWPLTCAKTGVMLRGCGLAHALVATVSHVVPLAHLFAFHLSTMDFA